MSNSASETRPVRTRPKLAITAGEPAGIGPDICLQIAAQHSAATEAAELVVIADPELLHERARQLGIKIDIIEYRADTHARTGSGTLTVLPVQRAHAGPSGVADPVNARYVLATLDRAVAGCLAGEFDALVTGPVHKATINQAGIAFTGHTEYLAKITNTPQVVMMLATPGLRVALVTTHLPLRDVPAAITRERVESTLRIAAHGLQHHFGIGQPRILVCGLNPHAGESGELGSEDDEHIRPVIADLRSEGMIVSGPQPADTAFLPDLLAANDLVVAMYHDQGLPVLKHKGFSQAVNVTLGLPIIRTSVDHGTALELAGTGRAEIGSMLYALDTAREMAARGQRTLPG